MNLSLAPEHQKLFRTRVRVVLGILLSAVTAWIALDAFFGENARAGAHDDGSAIIVGAIMASGTITIWYYITRIALTHRALSRATTLVGKSLEQGSNKVHLENCTVRPLVKTKGFFWPMSEAVIFEDGYSRILLAPSLLTDEGQEALRLAWRQAGKELMEYYADALQVKHAPTGFGQS